MSRRRPERQHADPSRIQKGSMSTKPSSPMGCVRVGLGLQPRLRPRTSPLDGKRWRSVPVRRAVCLRVPIHVQSRRYRPSKRKQTNHRKTYGSTSFRFPNAMAGRDERDRIRRHGKRTKMPSSSAPTNVSSMGANRAGYRYAYRLDVLMCRAAGGRQPDRRHRSVCRHGSSETSPPHRRACRYMGR